jgi:hypothetical protein
MTRLLIGLDDTDRPGARISTARLARMLADVFDKRAAFIGAMAHRLFAGVPATTNNRASCIILDDEAGRLSPDEVLAEAASFVERHAETGSSPGLIVTRDVPRKFVDFGREASWRKMSRDEARACLDGVACRTFGDGTGLIGALAAIGLTEEGWSGRWFDFGKLRDFDLEMKVGALTRLGMIVVSIEMDAELPAPEDIVDTRRWLRPQLIAGQMVLPVRRFGPGMWVIASVKRTERDG